jgi:tetratricopeptide (TPR) repeat protein
VRLAVLDACQSAMGSGEDAFSSVATRLIQGGVDNVVAMSASVLVAATTRYFEKFYRELVGGVSTPTAQERARQALHDDPRRHMQQRRRDVEGKPVELLDWWLPHFYQQRPLVLRATRPSGQLDLPPASSERMSESMPAEPRYGFSGRAYELLQIERRLMQGQLVVIRGFGGVGKTALVRETADWLTRTKMYDAACFVSFEHGGDATTLLSALGNFLGVYDGHYNPNDAKAALAKLESVLKQKRTLVIADNMESILPGGDAPLEAALRSQLWDVLLKLSDMGAGVLLTTRDTNFGDGKMEPGKYVAQLALEGLHSEDAYALASRLLEYLGINRAKAPYVELRDVLQQLDYHPLAIQLVLPALRETSLSLAKIKADFAALLPKFVDDTETGRNRSLLASLDFSLRRLSEEQRALLPRLALFEGGASEDDLLAITEIPEGEWTKLRPALEQAALITAEDVHENIRVPFLRFHPVLAPYLRSLPGADDEALRGRYAKRYYGLARYLYGEDNRNPQAVRALVWLELPNLRRALELLLEADDLDNASDIANSIARFLNVFGLRRELEEWRQRVEKAVVAANTQNDGKLTNAEYLRESGLGEDELRNGDLQAAYARFMKLLERIKELPEDTPLACGSFEHCFVLNWIADCFKQNGQLIAAQGRLDEALAIINVLLRQQPDNEGYLRERGILLTSLGDVLRDQGRYLQSREAYEEALKIDKKLGDLRNQAVDLGQLGKLAMELRDFTEARLRYVEVLNIFRDLGEPESEAILWHLLGSAALGQKEWAEAERCYRESLAINESIGNIVNTAMTCNQLAIVAEDAGRPTEAEGWYKRQLELDEQVNPHSLSHARTLSNLASLLLNEVQKKHIPLIRLNEARGYAEQVLEIEKTFDVSSGIWMTLSTLSGIADLEGRTEDARNYRCRERETFAVFEGNRYHIDRQHGQLIADIVAAAKGDTQARAKVEADLPGYETNGWHIAGATKRIWAGERDWDSLVEDLDGSDALLILRVLETIAQPEEA